MTMDVRTWGNISLYDFELTNSANIYAPGSLEFYLVQGVVEFMQVYSLQVYAGTPCDSAENALGNYILKKLGENQVFIALDSWAKCHLSSKAVWHARVSGVLKLRSLKQREPLIKEVPLFGIYMESGITNIAQDAAILNELKNTSPDSMSLEHLLAVASLAQEKRQEYGIPTISIDSYNGNLIVSGIAQYIAGNMKEIPIQTWNRVTSEDVLAKTRGLFHHLGDELAYIMACLTLGDCCILGQDEFGEVMVLKHIAGLGSMHGKDDRYWVQRDKKPIKMGQQEDLTGLVLNTSDFKFIYGVPKSRAMLPTSKNHIFNHLNEDKANCSMTTSENCELDNKFWLNKEFLSLAGREIKDYTIREFVQKFYDVVALHLKNNGLFEIFSESYAPSNFLYNYKLKDAQTIELVEKIDKLIEGDFSYFVKTVAHKVNCAVINPQKNTAMGFFSKAGESAKLETNTLNLSFLINKLISYLSEQSTGLFKTPAHQNFTFNFMADCIIDFFVKEPSNFYEEVPEKNLYKYWMDLDIKALVVSELVNMDYEYRMFVVNGKLVATTACFRNTTPFNAWSEGVIDPRLCQGHNASYTIMNQDTRNLVAKYAKFARKFIRSIKLANPNILNYVLDVCQSIDEEGNKNIIPIEVNSINFSGAYQVDMRRIVSSICDKPIQKRFVNQMLDLQEIMENHTYTAEKENKEYSAA